MKMEGMSDAHVYSKIGGIDQPTYCIPLSWLTAVRTERLKEMYHLKQKIQKPSSTLNLKLLITKTG